MEGVDFDALWHNRESGGFSLAVLCMKCNVTASGCDCAKAAWILREKNRLFPGSVEAPRICHWCKKGDFGSVARLDQELGTHMPICRDCCNKIK